MKYQKRRIALFYFITFCYTALVFVLCVERFIILGDYIYKLFGVDVTNLVIEYRIRSVRLHLFSGYSFWDMVSNTMLFIPFGIIIMTMKKKVEVIFSLIIILLMTCFIEAMQFIFKTGVSDINDVVFNFLGGVIGIGIYLIIFKINKNDKIKTMKFIPTVSLQALIFLAYYLYDMFILLGERYVFSFVDGIIFLVYFLLLKILFLQDFTKKQLYLYYLLSIAFSLYFVFIFMAI